MSSTNDQQAVLVCPSCGHSLSTVESVDKSFCKTCGQVIGFPSLEGINVDVHSHKVTTGKHDQNVRTNLATEWNKSARIRDQSQKNFSCGLSHILQVIEEMGLSKTIIQPASDILLELFRTKVSRSHSIPSLSAACIYSAARLNDVPLAIDEIALHVGSKAHDVRHCIRLIERKLRLKLPPFTFVQTLLRITKFLPKQGESIIRLCGEHLALAEKSGETFGRNPFTVVAAVIYLVSRNNGRKISYKQLARASWVTETAIRNMSKTLSKISLPVSS